MTHGLHGVGTPPQKLADALGRVREREEIDAAARVRWGGGRK